MSFFGAIIAGFWSLFFVLVIGIIHISFAIGVYRDAKQRGNAILVQAEVWLLATIFGGVLVATSYWLMHHSRLNPANQVRQTETDNNLL